MSNAYILVFSSEIDRKSVSDFFDSMDGIDNWFYSLPNSIFLVGSVPALTISKRFMERFGQKRHFVTLISKKARQGWMPKKHWNLLPEEKSADDGSTSS